MSGLATILVLSGIWLVIGFFGGLVLATLRMIRADAMPLHTTVNPRTGERQHGFLRWLGTMTAVVVVPVWALLVLVYTTNALHTAWQALSGGY